MDEGLDGVLTRTQITHVTASAFTRSSLNHHHVAIVLSLKTGNVLASATNSATAYGSVHAEMAALQQLRRRLRDRALFSREVRRGTVLMSVRLNARGELRLAKPCAACAQAMHRDALIRVVGYSDDDGCMVYERYDELGRAPADDRRA